MENRFRNLVSAAVVLLLLLAASTPVLAEGSLRGTAKDAEGKPLEGVQVKLIPADESFITLEAVSNKKGRFVFGLIRPTNYRLIAFMDGMRIQHIDANVAIPDDDDYWSVREDLVQGAETPAFEITGLSKVTYDLVFAPHTGEPGAYGTGLPVSPTKVIVGMIGEGKLDEAIAEVRRNLDDDPESTVFNYLLAFALRADAKLDEALTAVDKALETDPAFEGANLLKGKILEERGEIEPSLEYYDLEASLATSPEVQRDALLAMAVVYEKLERFEDAVTALQRLVEVAPDHVGAYKELSDLYLRLGDEERAKAMMEEVAALGAQDPRLLYNLGAERFNAAEFEEAAEYFEQAVEIDPEFRDAYIRLAFTRLNLGDNEGAKESLQRFLDLSTEETSEVQTARAILQQLSK